MIKYPIEAVEHAKKIASLQNLLENITMENYSASILNLAEYESNLFQIPNSFQDIFIRCLFQAFQFRPKAILQLFDLFVWFLNREDAKQAVITFITNSFVRCHTNLEGFSKFAFDFLSTIFFSLDCSFDRTAAETVSYLEPFVEDLLSLNSEKNLIKIDIIKSALSYQSNEKSRCLMKQSNEHSEDTSSNEDKGNYSDYLLVSIIFNDDLEKLQEFVSSHFHFDLNMKISNNETSFLSCSLCSEMSLIEMAAWFGSVKIFKYLLINNVSLCKNDTLNLKVDVNNNNNANINNNNANINNNNANINNNNANINNNNANINNNIPNIDNNIPNIDNNIPNIDNNIPNIDNNIPNINDINKNENTDIKRTGVLSKLAVIGGNFEIIHLVEQKGFIFAEEEACEAAKYHRIDLLRWIIENNDVKSLVSIFESCLFSDFVEGFLYFIDNFSENENIFSSKKLIEKASINSSIDILQIMFSIPDHKAHLYNSFFFVVEFGELQSAKLLVNYFGNLIKINNKNSQKLTPIHISSQKGDKFMMNFLIDKFGENVDLNIQERYGSTPLHLAIRSNSYDTFKILLNNKNVDINLCDFGDSPPLFEAIYNNKNIEFLRALLEDDRIRVDICDQMGLDCLSLIISEKNIEMVKIFLNSKNKGGLSKDRFINSIFQALSSNLLPIFELLINSDIFINEIMNEEKFINEIAHNIKKAQFIMKYLLKNEKFQINQIFGEEKITVLHLCCFEKELNFLIPEILKRKDLEINKTDSFGMTPLHRAMKSQNNKYSTYLIKDQRVDINARDGIDQTPLHVAASNWSKTPLIELLHHPKINVNLTDKDGVFSF